MSDDLDDAAFMMGEEIAASLALFGVGSLSVGGKILVHATRLEGPREPLVGCGDPVRTGDLVEILFRDGSRAAHVSVGVLNYYDASTRDVSFVLRTTHGYSVSAASLGQANGGGFTRSFRLLEAGSDRRLFMNSDLMEDQMVALLDARFRAVGHPRIETLVDLPLVALDLPTRHGAFLGRKKALCGQSLKMPAAGSTVFDAALEGLCRSCVKRTFSLAKQQQTSPSFISRSLRSSAAALLYHKEFHSQVSYAS